MDILTQVEAVEKALKSLGYPSVRIPFTKNLESFIQSIKGEEVDIAFNLCESVDEDPRLAWHPASVLELLGIPFSGSPSVSLMLTTDKLLTKRLMMANGTSTPRYLVYIGQEKLNTATLRFPVIIKPRFEDASIGIDQESIFEDEEKLRRGLKDFNKRFGPLLVEEYIEGREFNISLLGYPIAKVMPPAEIDFSAFPERLYPIVGYRAKWDKNSFEYNHTPRVFPDNLPMGLLEKLKDTALHCFYIFQLRDYGRVDMRVDAHGKVYVLEVNANPCLSPDAGFAAASCKAGMKYSEMVSRLVNYTVQRTVNNDHKASHLSR
jgi:D-alanine-D-alanine ligase